MLATLLVAGATAATSADAQTGTLPVPPATPSNATRAVTPTTADATRGELTAALARAEAQARRASGGERERAQADAAAIRRRLQEGDMRVGDRLELTIVTDSASRQEVVVRDSVMIDLAPLPPLTLAGVLRSELQPYLLQYFKRFYREPQVRVKPQVRVLVTGAVGRPGFYNVAHDLQLADLLMTAGGPGGQAALTKVEIRRGDRRVMSPDDFQRETQAGRTLADVGVQPGDEVRVPVERRRDWWRTLRIGLLVVSLLVSLLTLSRRLAQE